MYQLNWWHLAGYWRLKKINPSTGKCDSLVKIDSSNFYLLNSITLNYDFQKDMLWAFGYPMPGPGEQPFMETHNIDMKTGENLRNKTIYLDKKNPFWNQRIISVYDDEFYFQLPKNSSDDKPPNEFWVASLKNSSDHNAVLAHVSRTSLWRQDTQEKKFYGMDFEDET
eukprot:UN33991